VGCRNAMRRVVLVNENELQELLADCLVLYHMAERGSWGSIQRHGLLSTSALLDLTKCAEASGTSLRLNGGHIAWFFAIHVRSGRSS
jgi:hypothetical protein